MFKAFPKIGQFRNVIKYMNFTGVNELKFKGSVKLHGTNAAISYCYDDDLIRYQSRNRILTVDDDNAGFAAWASQYEDRFKSALRLFASKEKPLVLIYGEWCGEGIQKGVAISELPKTFVQFATCLVDREGNRTFINTRFMDKEGNPNLGIENMKNILDYPSYDMVINLGNYEQKGNEITELVSEVEKCCPYAFAHGVEGVGEGIVWVAVDEDGQTLHSDYWFKTKGEKHSKSKVKSLKKVETLTDEQNAFIEEIVSSERLEQGWNYLEEMNIVQSKASTSHFIKWVMNDILAEESDRISEMGIKNINKYVVNSIKSWYFEKCL